MFVSFSTTLPNMTLPFKLAVSNKERDYVFTVYAHFYVTQKINMYLGVHLFYCLKICFYGYWLMCEHLIFVSRMHRWVHGNIWNNHLSLNEMSVSFSTTLPSMTLPFKVAVSNKERDYVFTVYAHFYVT